MSEYLEFKDEEIPKENPNPKNDIFKRDGAKGTDLDMAGIMIIGILIIIWGIYCRKVWFAMVFCLLLGGHMVYSLGKCLYQKYAYRKKIIENGSAYPGVIVETFDKTHRLQTGQSYGMDIMTYGVKVKYADKTLLVRELDGDARKYLENPYCTVYEWNGKVIAADFKVRDEYVAPDGKSYSLKPLKK